LLTLKASCLLSMRHSRRLADLSALPQDRFLSLLKRSRLPSRQSPTYNAAVRQRHAAILGICALVDSYPYTVERWMPELLTSVLAEHTYDPVSHIPPRSNCARGR